MKRRSTWNQPFGLSLLMRSFVRRYCVRRMIALDTKRGRSYGPVERAMLEVLLNHPEHPMETIFATANDLLDADPDQPVQQLFERLDGLLTDLSPTPTKARHG